MEYLIGGEGFEGLSVSDMGEGVLVLSQPNDSGMIERVAVSRRQIQEALDATAWRYDSEKNTDQRPVAA